MSAYDPHHYIEKDYDDKVSKIVHLERMVRDLTEGNENLYHQRETLKAEVKKLSALLTERNRDLEDAIRALRAAPGDERDVPRRGLLGGERW
jgi:peptidoglycan hydrolase CwlO-like protein